MDDKERLEVINRTVTGVYDTNTKKITGVNLRIDDYNWFIEQAERVQELERSEAEWVLFPVSMNATREIVEKQNKRYHELLESIRYTQDIADEIFKTTDKKVISPDDLLQHILRKVNKFLEESE